MRQFTTYTLAAEDACTAAVAACMAAAEGTRCRTAAADSLRHRRRSCRSPGRGGAWMRSPCPKTT